MSLLGNATLANIDKPYYSGGGGGGGGPNLVVSTITSDSAVVSSITAAPGNNGLSLVGDVAGILMDGGSGGVFITGPGLFFPDNGDIDFQLNNGEITGLSSINGAAYPPPGAAAPVSTIVGSATIGSVPVHLVPAGPTLSTGKGYMFNVVLDAPTNGVIGAPSVGDHVGFVLPDTSTPFTIDLVQLSTMKAAGQPLGFSFAAPFVAGAGAFNVSAYCNAGATASTLIGASGVSWLTPLN